MADEVNKKIDVVSSVFPTTANDDTTLDPWKSVREEVKERFELLPENIQNVITGGDYQKHLFDIAKAQKLTYEELGVLEVETTMVLLGMVNPNDYRDELQTQLKKNDPDIDMLVSIINTQVFAPIREEIEKIYAAQKDPADYLADVPAVKETTPATQTATPSFGSATPFSFVNNLTSSAPTPVATQTPKAPSVVPPVLTPSLSATDKNILEKTGVVISETPATVRPAQFGTMPTRDDMLKNIENPPKTAFTGIVADKLKNTTPAVAPTKTTDYSIPKPPPTTPSTGTTPAPSRGADPYREAIN